MARIPGPLGERYFEFYNNVGVFNGYNDLTDNVPDELVDVRSWWYVCRL